MFITFFLILSSLFSRSMHPIYHSTNFSKILQNVLFNLSRYPTVLDFFVLDSPGILRIIFSGKAYRTED